MHIFSKPLMFTVSGALVLGALAFAAPAAPAVASSAAVVTQIGDVGHCDGGKAAILVRVSGFKTREGELRLDLYDGNPDNWLVGGKKIHKVHMYPIPQSGPVDVCVKVPGPGTYAFGLQHDVNRDYRLTRIDGGAFSNNARVTLLERKPRHSSAAFTVGNRTKRVGIRLLYLRGLSIGPTKNPV